MHTAVSARQRTAVRSDTYLLTHVLGVTLLLAVLAEASRLSGLDMAIARMFFDGQANAFPWRDSRLLELIAHRIVLVLPVGLAVGALAAAVASHWFHVLRPWRGALWAIVLTCALGQVVISQLKHYTALPRPYNLDVFGGYAHYPQHFWAVNRKEAGGALPSNHAGAGYAMLALYFAGWALGSRTWRWAGLAAGIAAGLLFSLVRIMQGAHFFSQTLWAACVMWGLASILFYLPIVRAAPAGQGGPDGGWSTGAEQDARQP
ncbi:acid phosphatase [Bordetella genomosp. 9]|uniref:phosphatase PAP2 family protein n=1 Tax=Bordetella genomosp. 9 TaxID=1416803 RepID=UPI000A291BBB|nr:phosphatase PAP2 family protein [Bordetella genomosp. 9]ARP89198.1 acid phosphatase [Bordetella genomosp. 9]